MEILKRMVGKQTIPIDILKLWREKIERDKAVKAISEHVWVIQVCYIVCDKPA